MELAFNIALTFLVVAIFSVVLVALMSGFGKFLTGNKRTIVLSAVAIGFVVLSSLFGKDSALAGAHPVVVAVAACAAAFITVKVSKIPLVRTYILK